MTLTAREAMQALLEGKTIYRRGFDDSERKYMFKLSEKGQTVEWFDNGWMETMYIPLNGIEDVIEEYPLNFEQALRAMLDGKIVTSDLYPHLKQRFHDGCFEFKEDDAEWRDTYFAHVEQKAKWKVVE
ncbi:MAG: hypothetical protein J6K69_07210 [Candidatus Methanomethylophilaceae archaeon]|nr:hypothetical protein [Candidatus Methanomethylophilaceae archaeon]